jgi:uncharacterized protein (TIGR00251 family)
MAIEHTFDKGTLFFSVRVVTRASRSGAAGEHDGALKLRIAAPPVDGAANEEVVKVLAKLFSVSRSHVSIVSGQTSRLKRIAVTGFADAVSAERTLRELAG